jgi:hypothetical protein
MDEAALEEHRRGARERL